MAQLYSPAWASPAVAVAPSPRKVVAPSPRKVVAGIALADEGSMSFEELLDGADADMSPRSSHKRARTKKKSLWKALQRLVRHTHMPLDGATTPLNAVEWSEPRRVGALQFRGEARARHRSGPDAWDRACLRAESSFRDDVASRASRTARRRWETPRPLPRHAAQARGGAPAFWQQQFNGTCDRVVVVSRHSGTYLGNRMFSMARAFIHTAMKHKLPYRFEGVPNFLLDDAACGPGGHQNAFYKDMECFWLPQTSCARPRVGPENALGEGECRGARALGLAEGDELDLRSATWTVGEAAGVRRFPRTLNPGHGEAHFMIAFARHRDAAEFQDADGVEARAARGWDHPSWRATVDSGACAVVHNFSETVPMMLMTDDADVEALGGRRAPRRRRC
ncbi:FMN binding protein [Aureococcus anophagefferens]|nr:FMN binding protein [Aureococcus anophagefferens]